MRVTFEAIGNLFRKPFTRKYPKTKVYVAKRFRGRIKYYPLRCNATMLCVRNCPVGAIRFYKKGKIEFDMTKCILCGLCQDVCPKKAIKITNEFEYADSNKEKVKKNLISSERFPGLEKES